MPGPPIDSRPSTCSSLVSFESLRVLLRLVCESASPFAFRPFAFAFCAGFAGPSLKHLTRRVPKTIGNYVAAQHPGDLVHTARGVEAADRRPRPSASDPFLDLKVRVGIRGHLGEMRDAEHLKRRSERPQAAPDDIGRAAADPGIHFIEDQSRGGGARGA